MIVHQDSCSAQEAIQMQEVNPGLLESLSNHLYYPTNQSKKKSNQLRRSPF